MRNNHPFTIIALMAFGAAIPIGIIAITEFIAAPAPNTFNLVATTWGQQVNGYVIDSGLSGADCIAALEARPATVELEPGLIVATATVSLACELTGLGVEL